MTAVDRLPDPREAKRLPYVDDPESILRLAWSVEDR